MFTERIKTHHSAMGSSKSYMRGMKTIDEVLCNHTSLSDKAVIYIHVPFCAKICSFCNMRRSLQEPHKEYHQWIIREIENYAGYEAIQNTKFDAVYFGGGTPTTLSTEALRDILRSLKSNLHFTEDAEFTIETTLTELTTEKMVMFKAEGVTRFSIGVQTFDDNGRKQMGRLGDGAFAISKIKELKAYGFQTISTDLIYNYKGQTVEELKEDLSKMIELDLNGFSMYSLINMEDTSIDPAQSLKSDEVLFSFIKETMETHGYQFLELTKMVKNDKYKYVMNRHKGADTLPLGAGAGGEVGGLMIMNPIKLDEYQDSVCRLGKRQGMYFDPSFLEVKRFKGDIQSLYLPQNESLYRSKKEYKESLERMIKEGYIEPEGDRYHFTSKGIFWGNTISAYLSSLCVPLEKEV
jgi:coproporphyrinogen III oxidase-like Fe-S oxidoreductase